MSTNTPLFDPPYDSPIEEAFAWAITKHLHPDVRFDKQVEQVTLLGTFRVDFVAYYDQVAVGFECDGEEFHEPFRDECRDAMILGDGLLDAIYRIRGKDIHHHVDDCLYLMSRWDPKLFSVRAHVNLKNLSTQDARKCWPPGADTVLLRYQGSPFSIVLERRSRIIPKGERRHWEFLHAYAIANGIKNVDDLVQSRKQIIRQSGI